MKIAQIAPFEEAVPPIKYGGTELIVHLLSEGLAKNGHEVCLFASGDSKCKVDLQPIFPKSIRKMEEPQDMKKRDALKYIGIAEIFKRLHQEKFDIIHNHIGWRFLPFASMLNGKVITTLHGPLNVEYQNFVYKKFKDCNFVSISNSQRRPLRLNFIATVYNGIDLSQFTFENNPQGNYLSFLARMSPEKGPLQAIEIAKKAKMELKMAAKVDAVDKEYFEKNVKPLIDQKQIKFVGEIGPKEKDIFLRDSVALLSPLQWEEPFGLFMAEANACGTPVIGFKRGSVPELIKNGVNGFVVENVSEAVKAIKKIGQIDRADCRKWVEENFSKERMVREYEKAYQKIL